MVQAPVQPLTLESFLALPQTKPASEYIDGTIVQKPMPKPKHSLLQAKLIMTINEVLNHQKMGFAFPELRCVFGDRAIVPDVSVLQWDRIPLDENGDISDEFESYPDWAIEIVSPQQAEGLIIDKILHALNHGTQMGWLINPNHRTIVIFPAGKQPHLVKEISDRLQPPDFAQSVNITRQDVFSWLKI